MRADSTLSVGGFTLLNKGLVGVGRIPADLRDKFGETFGSGSGMAVDAKSWSRNGAAYAGTIYLLPDRGYNVTGTIDYRSRLNKLSVVLTPADDPASLAPEARQRTVQATLADTIMLVDRAGQNLSGLDPVAAGIRPAGAGLPPMPQAPNGYVALDSEGVVLLPGGAFFVSDEYGPYIYRFSPDGRMIGAIRPPDAFIPRHIAGTKYDGLTPLAPKGRLADGVVAAATQPFIDLNDNAELAKFGLHNGPPQDRNNLGEKWEAMGLVPALDPTHPRDVFLLVANDNDFITQHGFHAGQAYADASGADLDTMILVYRITLPAPPK